MQQAKADATSRTMSCSHSRFIRLSLRLSLSLSPSLSLALSLSLARSLALFRSPMLLRSRKPPEAEAASAPGPPHRGKQEIPPPRDRRSFVSGVRFEGLSTWRGGRGQ